MTRRSILILAFVAIGNILLAQVAINNAGLTPHGSAMLDVSSTLSGVLIPRMTLTERDAIPSPANGLMVYQTTNTRGFYYYSGVAWRLVGSGALGIDDLTDGIVTGGSTYLGTSAGLSDDGSNNFNVGIGYNALRYNTEGYFNTATGYQSLYTNSTGTHNTANGYQSFHFTTLGTHNTGIGFRSGYQNTIGSNNTCLGYNANFYNVAGGGNTIVGCMAGMGSAAHNKTGNVFLGYSAGFHETGSNKLYIENSDATVPLIYGEFDNNLIRINGTLDINNAYQLPTADGAASQVLKTNGSGGVSWVDDNGATDINGLSDGKFLAHSLYLGIGAGYIDDGTDNNNVGVGEGALRYNTSGYFNSATGYRALYNNIDGIRNTANGYQAMYENTNGGSNTAIGFQNSRFNSSGNFNTSLGYNANYYNAEGDSNTIIGYMAGFGSTGNNITGNIFLGYQAGYNETGNYKLYIENSNSSSPLIYGEFDNDLVRINGTLDINNAYTLPASDGASGQVLSTNGSGALSWTDDAGASALDDLSDAIYDGSSLFLGSSAGTFDDGTTNRNVAVGRSAMYNTNTGEDNTALGYYAMSENRSGSKNTATGYYSLWYNYGGSENTAFGHSSLFWNFDGINNTGIGKDALHNNSSGNNNTAIGYKALYTNESSSNTAVGTKALYFNDGGYRNSAVGMYSSYNISDGIENTGMGYEALYSNVSGWQNTAIGYRALFGTTGSYNTALGSNAGPADGYGSISNTTIIGESTYAYASNYTYIGNTSMSWIGGQVTWSTYSDERMKDNVREDVKGLDFIMKLRPVTYHVSKDRIDNIMGLDDQRDYPEKYDIEKIKQSGFLAQEVEQAANASGYDFSGLHVPPNINTPYSISYAEFVVPLVKAVQEQQEIIDKLQREIEDLKGSAFTE